jgi:hypothetical protein
MASCIGKRILANRPLAAHRLYDAQAFHELEVGSGHRGTSKLSGAGGHHLAGSIDCGKPRKVDVETANVGRVQEEHRRFPVRRQRELGSESF